MKRRLIVLFPILFLLTSCLTALEKKDEPPVVEEEKYYAFFMNNYPRATDQAASGFDERVENTLYQRIEIQPDVPFSKPDKDPERVNYEFQGWFKEKTCSNEWDFEKDSSKKTLYLYAKWGQVKSEEYMEPEYVFPEKIIDDADFRLNGIFNTPIVEGEVKLTAGAINRLINGKDDVSFAISYERRESISFTATYDVTNKEITVNVSNSESHVVKVVDVTASKSVQADNPTFESKAQKYETLGTTYENYHIALAGSSSMENWSNSTIDMSPIVTFNHGIGGTKVEHWTEKLFDRLVLPYLPKAVVYYVGVNNIINGEDRGEDTGKKLIDLFNKTHEFLPETQIFYVLINKLPGYPKRQNDFDEANGFALEYEKTHSYLTCIDAGAGLLKDGGLPNAACFLSDGLHMSDYGYSIWGPVIKNTIIEWLDKE